MKDYLTLHLQDLPYFRALLRAVEARFYKDITLPPPVLDLGCGDGHFASLAWGWIPGGGRFKRPLLEIHIITWFVQRELVYRIPQPIFLVR